MHNGEATEQMICSVVGNRHLFTSRLQPSVDLFEFPFTVPDKSEDEQKQELMKAKLLPLKPIELSFWAKFTELQVQLCFIYSA